MVSLYYHRQSKQEDQAMTNSVVYCDGVDRQFCMAYLNADGSVRAYYSPCGACGPLDCAALSEDEAHAEGLKYAQAAYGQSFGVIDWRSHDYTKPAPRFDPTRFYKALPLPEGWRND